MPGIPRSKYITGQVYHGPSISNYIRDPFTYGVYVKTTV